ncbi:TolC family protein [Porticoccus sp. W117]|uniref:TolC family protein n=1 Tax=Porticoccus sp. W117 TaxID=3054777 RepID=UPI0025922507|nr:TolC family protein [Porticoccus sp. W117]MDM3872461.1 TolC family protein [Porticoccus sp. W117]
MKKTLLSAALLFSVSHATQAESLADIYRQALLNDPTYLSAEVEMKIGENGDFKAWANFLPKLNIDPSGNYNRSTDADLEQTRDGVEQPIVPGSSRTFKNASLGRLTFNLGINDWFQFKNNLMENDLAQATFAKAQQELIIRVTDKYFAVLEAHADLQAKQKAEEYNRLQLDLAEERLKEGLNTITDTHTARNNYYSAQIESQQALLTFDQAFEELTLLTGKAHHSLDGFGQDIPAPDPAPLDSDKWVSAAIENSYDLKISKINRNRARNTSKADKYFYLPNVNATVNGSTYSSSPSSSRIQQIPIQNPDGTITFIESETVTPSTRTIREGGNNVRIDLSIPLFGDNGLSWIDRKEKAQREQIAQQNFVKSYRQTEFTVRSNFISLRNQKKRLELEEKRLNEAELAYEKTRIEYEHGTKNLIELTSQQQSLLNSQIARNNAQYNYIESLLRLKQEAGQLTPADVLEIDSWLNNKGAINATQRSTL